MMEMDDQRQNFFAEAKWEDYYNQAKMVDDLNRGMEQEMDKNDMKTIQNHYKNYLKFDNNMVAEGSGCLPVAPEERMCLMKGAS